MTHLKRGVVGQLLGHGADVGVVELGGELEGGGQGGHRGEGVEVRGSCMGCILGEQAGGTGIVDN